MTRLEALERVAEAAQILAHSCGTIRGNTPEDDDIYTVELDHIRELNAALDALPTEAQGEMMEVRGHVRLNTMDPTVYVVEGGGKIDGSEHWPRNAGVFATITARVPLPRVPEIVATVEAGE